LLIFGARAPEANTMSQIPTRRTFLGLGASAGLTLMANESTGACVTVLKALFYEETPLGAGNSA
jgi:hypothetical protein